nr:immunoglobulin light chain junction region [Mus musculus]
CQHHYDTPLTF